MATLKNRRREAAAKTAAKRTPRAAAAAKQAAEAAGAAAAAATQALAAEQQALAAEQQAADRQAALDVSRETPDPIAVATLETLQQSLVAQQRIPDPDPVAMATIETLRRALARQNQTLSDLTQLVTQQGKQLEMLLKRPVEVTAGEVEVNMPDSPKPTSFVCEFDDGRTATLTPVYDDRTLN